MCSSTCHSRGKLCVLLSSRETRRMGRYQRSEQSVYRSPGPVLIKGEWPEYPMGTFDHTHVQVMTNKRLDRWCRTAGLRKEAEFDLYDFRFFRRNSIEPLTWQRFDFSSFLTFEIQARYRRCAVKATSRSRPERLRRSILQGARRRSCLAVRRRGPCWSTSGAGRCNVARQLCLGAGDQPRNSPCAASFRQRQCARACAIMSSLDSRQLPATKFASVVKNHCRRCPAGGKGDRAGRSFGRRRINASLTHGYGDPRYRHSCRPSSSAHRDRP